MLDTLIVAVDAARRHQVEVDPERLRPIDADLQVPDTAKFRAHTGWEPQSLQQTMQDLLDYWRERVDKS